jgi:hypothetical protein
MQNELVEVFVVLAALIVPASMVAAYVHGKPQRAGFAHPKAPVAAAALANCLLFGAIGLAFGETEGEFVTPFVGVATATLLGAAAGAVTVALLRAWDRRARRSA